MTFLLAGVLGVVFLALAAARGLPLRGAVAIALVYWLVGGIAPVYIDAWTDVFLRGVYPLDSQLVQFSLVLSATALIIVMYSAKIFDSIIARKQVYVVVSANNKLSAIFSVAAIVLTVVYIFLMSQKFGGVSGFMSRAYLRVQYNDSGANYLSVLSWGGLAMCVFAVHTTNWKQANILSRVLVASAVIISAYHAMVLGGRSIAILFMYALAYRMIMKASFSRLALLGLAGGAAVLFISSAMIELRWETQNALILHDPRQSGFIARATTGLMFIDHIALSMDYARTVGHDAGRLYANILTFPVPRDIWPDKPLQISSLLREYRFGLSNGGVPPGLLGEAFIAFSVPGVLAVSVLYGFFLQQCDRIGRIGTSLNCAMRTSFAANVAPLLGFALLRGGFDIGATRIGIPVFWCLLACGVCLLVNGSRSHARLRRPQHVGGVVEARKR